jgi:CheY-like chemotaxis protein
MTDQHSSPASVLIVEDEMLVRMFAVDALEDVGFQVLQAGDAGEPVPLRVGQRPPHPDGGPNATQPTAPG